MKVILKENARVVKEYSYRGEYIHLKEVLKEYLEEKYENIFDENGFASGFTRLFLNDSFVENVNTIKVKDKDVIHLTFSISGG